MPPKYAAKRDRNEAEIIEALRAAGCSVTPLNSQDIPDLLVGFPDDYGFGINLLMEVKMPKGKLSAGQKTWHRDWLGQCVVVRSIEEALDIVVYYRKRS